MHQWLISFLFFLILLSGCGRKQRTIFYFPEQNAVRILTLQLASPKITRLCKTSHGIHIQWLAPAHRPNVEQAELIGYNIYRLTRHGFIPKKPLNEAPITKTEFYDVSTKPSAERYAVRAIFKMHGQLHEGPTSNICALH